MAAITRIGGSATQWNIAGALLIVFAFAAPFVAALAGYLSPGEAGYGVGQTFMALAFLMLIAWLATRKGTPLEKGRARTVVGVLLVLMVSGQFQGRIEENARGKAFLWQSLARNQAQTASFVELGKRFDKVNLESVLTVPHLTSRAGIAEGRATVAQYRTLLAERKAAVQTYLTAFEASINALPAGETQNGARAGLSSTKAVTVKTYGDLDQAQGARMRPAKSA